ncbi:uncharacterized protein PHACADRAFT_261968 [Phanerochaete carnosa HHB-10118-sp]|uniref:Uncharacterized protein n=1 Tax=Phanerochaete carnosa (strain HHB-10118-sp) TaxID=650164 RepID=K5WMX5_PHACS|nr:uncharacterized protein PHACADRAFT_261968 [Phanerochaete carnosa HHB-10118-sp]EKM51682.1 hypothetical protein PHACADRAFT_261968 [Phanerochaete carnosa HHB-10118-sp]
MREASILLVHPSQVRVPIPELPIKRRLPSGAVAQIAGISWKAYRMADTKLLEDQVVGPLGMRGLLADQFKSGALDWNGASLVPTKDAHGSWGTRATRLQAIANRHGVFRWLRIQ